MGTASAMPSSLRGGSSRCHTTTSGAGPLSSAGGSPTYGTPPATPVIVMPPYNIPIRQQVHDLRSQRTGTARSGGYVGRMRRGLPAVVLLVTACSSTPPPPPPPPATPTYELPPRPVRPDEKPLKMAPVQDGDTQFQLIGLTADQPELTGSHVQFEAKGAY